MSSSLFREEALAEYERRGRHYQEVDRNQVRYPAWVWIVVAFILALLGILTTCVRVPEYIAVSMEGDESGHVRLVKAPNDARTWPTGTRELHWDGRAAQGTIRSPSELNDSSQVIFVSEEIPELGDVPRMGHLEAESKSLGLVLMNLAVGDTNE